MNKNYSFGRTNWLKLGLLPLLAILFAVNSFGQVSAYSFTQSTGTYTPITGGTVVATAAAGGNSFDSQAWTIASGSFPFSFPFNGSNNTGCFLSSNGFITFGVIPSAFTTTPLSTTLTGSTGKIAAWAGDLNTFGGVAGKTGEVRWETVGTAPNREVVIQFSNWKPNFVNSTTAVYSMDYQYRLHENGRVQIVYGNLGTIIGSPTASGARQIGLGGSVITDYHNRLNAAGTAFTASTAGTANTSSQNFNIVTSPPGMPTSGLTYQWSPPTCFAPTAVTMTFTSTSAGNMSWTAPALGSPSSYDWEVRTSGAAGSGATGLFASGNVTAPTVTASVTGMAANTTYTMYVRTFCGGVDYSTWTAAATFTTPCAATAAPLAEAFAATIPACWNNSSTDGSLWSFVTADATNGVAGPAAGTHFARLDVFNINSTVNINAEYYLRTLPVALGVSPKTLTYRYFLGSGGYTTASPSPLRVQVSTDLGATYTTVYTHSSTNSTIATSNAVANWGSNSVDLSAYSGQTVLVRFVGKSNYGSGTCNMGIDEVAFVSCAAPSGVTATLSGTGANFSWSGPANASGGYEWEVRTSGAAGSGATGLITSGSGTATTASVTGLASLVAHQFYVRSNCGGGDFSTWTQVNFTSNCAGTPNTAAITPTTASVCLNGPNQLFTSTGHSTGTGFTYQWEYSADGLTGWTPVTGGTTANLSVQANALVRYYRQVTTCAGSGLTSTSNVVTLNGTVGGACSPAYGISRTTGITYNQLFPAGTAFTGWSGGTYPGDEETSATVTIPFTFNYYGVNYTSFRVNTNGFISMGATLGSGIILSSIGVNTATRNAIIAPMWADLVVPGGTAANNHYISYQVTGTSPNQVLTIEWAGMEKFLYAGPNMNFQVKLYEGTNNIEFLYGSMTGTNGTANSAYTYSTGINSAVTGTLTGANVVCQQQFNTDIFGAAAQNSMTVVPECNTSILFTNGGSLSGGNPLPAITNDAIGGAIPIATGTSSPAEYCGWYRSKGATASAGIATCGAGTPGNADDDVWFTFFNPSAQDIRVSVVPEAGYDAVVQVFSDNAGAVSLGCVNGSGAGLLENLNLPALAAGQYWVRVYDAAVGSSVGGHFYVSAYNPPPVPGNDEGATAVTLAGGATCTPISGTSLGASQSAITHVPAAGVAGIDDDVWYKFDAISTSAEIQVQSGSAYNAAFQLYDAGVAPGTFNAAIPAFGAQINNTSTTGLESNIYTGLTIGNTYYVRVYHVGAGSGTTGGFTICRRDICQDVTAVTAVASNTLLTATFTWTGGNADIYYGATPLTAPTVSTTPTATNVTSPQAISGLTADTQYALYVRSNCGALVGNWVGPVSYDTFCPALTAFSVTSNPATLTATATWTGGNGDLYYVVSGGAAPTLSTTPSVSNVASGYVISSLAPGTIYDLYFRSNCGGGSTGLWSTVRNFDTYLLVPAASNNTITSCNAVLADHAGPSANYSTNVDGYTVINATSPTAYMGISGTYNTEAGFDYVRIYQGSGIGGTLLFQSPLTPSASIVSGTFSVNSTVAGGALTIRFSSDGSAQAGGFTATVQCSDCAPLSAITAVGDAFNMDADITWTGGAADIYYGTAPLTAPTGSTTPTVSNVTSVYNITGLTAATNYTAYIRSNCGVGGSGFWQGPFNFNTTCPALVGTPNVLTNPTAGTGVINWTSGIADFYYGTSISAPTGSTTPTVSAASPGATISGLVSSQNYTLYYRSNCSGNYGAWQGPVAFNTFITVPASGNNTLTLCNATIYDSGGPNGNYQDNETGYLTIYPPAGKVFDITINIIDFDSGWDYLELYEGVDNTGTAWGVATNVGLYTTLTSSLPGGPVTIATNSDGIDNFSGYEIQVACVNPPPCPNLTPFTASAYGAGFQAPYSCGAGCTSATVQIEYGAPGFAQGTGTTVSSSTNPAIVTGLAATTAYQYYIRRDCTGTGDGYAAWAGPFNVTTSVANDVCVGAEAVICGSVVTATTVGAGNDLMVDQCGAATGTQTAPGLWYSIAGNNQEITVTSAGYDSRLSVYTGSCGALSCIIGNDDAGGALGLGSSVTFNSITGNNYYILVHGFGTSTGSFTLNVTCNPLCSPQQANDLCSGATALSVQSPYNTVYTAGNSTCATAGPTPNIDFTCGGTFSIYKDLWYTFDSDELSSVILSMNPGAGTPASGTYYYALYTGSCSNMTYANACGAFTVGNPVSMTVTPQTIYHLRVYSSSTSTFTAGTFNLAVVEPYTNDLRANALAIAPRSYPTCISANVVTQNLDLATGGTGALGGAAPAGAGQDLWYRFTATTNACRLSATSANDTYMELQNAAGTTLIESENDGINTILLNDALTPGQQYYVLVRNQDATNGGAPTTVCLQYLGASVCNNVSNNFTSLCSGFKASYTGANSYTGNFTEVPTGGDPVADTFTFSTTGGSTTIPMSSVSGMQYGRSYNVLVNTSYNLMDGAANSEVITVNGTSPCTISIAAHAELDLRASDASPNQRFLNSTVGATAWICGASYYKWEFTQLTPAIGVATTFDGPAGNRFLALASVNAAAPGFLLPGATYNVRVAPVFGTVVGTYGAVDQVLKIAGSAMPIVDGEELENLEVRNEEFNGEEVALYPNPNNGAAVNLNVYGVDTDKMQVRILDGMGRVVYNNQFVVEGSLNTIVSFEKPLASGLYMVEFIYNGKTETQRMMVQK